jgi:hypothetical protein
MAGFHGAPAWPTSQEFGFFKAAAFDLSAGPRKTLLSKLASFRF